MGADGADKDLVGLRVLIVEDMFHAAVAMQELLELERCEVVGPVSTLERALETIHDERIDGALLDINLRGEQVYPAADLLAELGIPYIFLTGYDSDSLPDEYRADPCLEKPVDAAELKHLIARLFGERPAAPSAP